jgi:hypothetical protein
MVQKVSVGSVAVSTRVLSSGDVSWPRLALLIAAPPWWTSGSVMLGARYKCWIVGRFTALGPCRECTLCRVL